MISANYVYRSDEVRENRLWEFKFWLLLLYIDTDLMKYEMLPPLTGNGDGLSTGKCVKNTFEQNLNANTYIICCRWVKHQGIH